MAVCRGIFQLTTPIASLNGSFGQNGIFMVISLRAKFDSLLLLFGVFSSHFFYSFVPFFSFSFSLLFFLVRCVSSIFSLSLFRCCLVSSCNGRNSLLHLEFWLLALFHSKFSVSRLLSVRIVKSYFNNVSTERIVSFE